MLGMLGGDWVSVQSNGTQPLSTILREGVVDAPDINAIATRRPQELDILVWNYHDDDIATDPAAIRVLIEDLPEQKCVSSSSVWTRTTATLTPFGGRWAAHSSRRQP